jgi:hypothetical protein
MAALPHQLLKSAAELEAVQASFTISAVTLLPLPACRKRLSLLLLSWKQCSRG